VRLRMVAGGEGHAGGAVAAGERAADSRGCGQCRGDAGNNLKVQTGFSERGDLLGGAAEDQWISALEAHDSAMRWRALSSAR